MTADQSPLFPRASTDRLRTILAARLPADPKWVAWIDGVVGELAGCVVEDPRLTQIRALCDDAGYAGLPSNLVAQVRAVLGAPPVAATPSQGIDRDALITLITQDSEHESWSAEAFADRILALVRPVEGVVLSDQDRQWAAHALREIGPTYAAPYQRKLAAEIASRLEASS